MPNTTELMIAKAHPGLSVYIVSKLSCMKAIVHIDKYCARLGEIDYGETYVANVYTPDFAVCSYGSGRCITAALAGTAGVDGIRLYDSNATDERTERLAERMRAISHGHPQFEVVRKQARKVGAKFTVFDKGTYQRCFYEPGFARLEAMGYDVTKVF